MSCQSAPPASSLAPPCQSRGLSDKRCSPPASLVLLLSLSVQPLSFITILVVLEVDSTFPFSPFPLPLQHNGGSSSSAGACASEHISRRGLSKRDCSLCAGQRRLRAFVPRACVNVEHDDECTRRRRSSE